MLLGAVAHIVATFAATFTIGFRVRGDHGAGIDVDSARDAARHAGAALAARTRRWSSSARSSASRCRGVLAELVGVRTVFFLCAALSVALAIGGRMFSAVKTLLTGFATASARAACQRFS